MAEPEPYIRAGANRDFPPFCRFAGGVPEGLVVDRVTAALSVVGVAIEWRPLALPDMMAALDRGDVEVLIGIGASADREERLDLSLPIVVTGGAGFTRAGLPAIDLETGPTSWGKAGLRAVSPAAGPLLAGLRATPGLRAEDGVDYRTSLAMVLDGRADVAALNFHVGREMAERDHPGRFRLPRRPYLEVALVAAVPKGRHGALLDSLNAGLRRLSPA